MKKIKIYTNEVLLDALMCMGVVNKRKSITKEELERYQKHIESECLKEEIEVEFLYDCTERLTRLRELVDTIMVDGRPVYRLNPSAANSDIGLLIYYYVQLRKNVGTFTHVDAEVDFDEMGDNDILLRLKQMRKSLGGIPGMDSWSFFSSCKDFTAESEAECLEFQNVDKKHQLHIAYQLFQIEQQRRILERSWNTIKDNTEVRIDDIEAEGILEKEPGISRDEFVSKIVR